MIRSWLSRNLEWLFLVVVLVILALAAQLGCATRPNVTRYMKEQESSLAVERCIERFLFMTRGQAVGVDFELQVISRETETNESSQYSHENVELGTMLCTALYRPETFHHMPKAYFLDPEKSATN